MAGDHRLTVLLERVLEEVGAPARDGGGSEAARRCERIEALGEVSVRVSPMACDPELETPIHERMLATAVQWIAATLAVTSSLRDQNSGHHPHANEIATWVETSGWKNSGKTKAMATSQRGMDAS